MFILVKLLIGYEHPTIEIIKLQMCKNFCSINNKEPQKKNADTTGSVKLCCLSWNEPATVKCPTICLFLLLKDRKSL